MQQIQVWFLGRKDPLEEGMETHSSILAWKIPWTEDPGRLQSIELQRVGHNGSDRACTQGDICDGHTGGQGLTPASTVMLLNSPPSTRQHPHNKESSAPNVPSIQDGKHCFIIEHFHLRFFTAGSLGKPRVLVYFASKVKEVCNAS